MFIRLFVRILAIFCMIGAGILARRLNILNKETAGQMSRAVTNFFYPALIFSSLVGNFTLRGLVDNWALPIGAILIMLTGYILGVLFSRAISFSDDKEKNQFLFQSTINNYSFLPLPIILMLWGNVGVAGLIFSTLGSELSVWTLGIFALAGNKFRKENIKELLSVPMLAIFASIMVIAIRDVGVYSFAGTFLGEVGLSFFSVLDIFGKGTIPVAMFIAGSRVAELKPHHLFTLKQGYVVALRLLLIPAIVALILYLIPFLAESRHILLVVAIMPSAISSVVLSEVYNSDTDFAASSVLTTHLFSLVTIPVWLSIFLK